MHVAPRAVPALAPRHYLLRVNNHHFVNASYPRSVRLTQAHEYKRVHSKAGRLSSDGLILLFTQNGLNYSRLGLAVSKKHLKHATQRNLVKRLIREQFRQCRGDLAGADVVLLSRAKLTNLDQKQIWQELEKLFEKLQQRCKS